MPQLSPDNLLATAGQHATAKLDHLFHCISVAQDLLVWAASNILEALWVVGLYAH